MGYAVAALARPQRERHLVVATPTIFTLQNLFHADGIGTRLGHEYLRVAITAREPTRMGEVREARVRRRRRGRRGGGRGGRGRGRAGARGAGRRGGGAGRNATRAGGEAAEGS